MNKVLGIQQAAQSALNSYASISSHDQKEDLHLQI